MGTTVQRLSLAIRAVCPITTARILSPGVGGFDPAPSATAEQRAAGAAALAAFDWSQTAQDAWQLIQDRLAAQTSWDAPAERLFRGLVLVLLDEINILRGQHGLPPRTVAQLRTAVRNRIETGEAD